MRLHVVLGLQVACEQLAQGALAKLPRDSNRNRVVNRCALTGLPWGFLRRFGLSRAGCRRERLAGPSVRHTPSAQGRPPPLGPARPPSRKAGRSAAQAIGGMSPREHKGASLEHELGHPLQSMRA
ncbi:uS14 family ribosomal protein [Stigmatella aurantiaca]|uniref:30S ribosomal protein S14 n=1 Tax=Stigmatella aurantiaca (strain DW4/3-1) TaxID=378806 RepID=E3FK98_STIAD|nr:30S ribosomal protein S14 [Stigmatella aurantiaca DW4/3-1]